MLVLVIGGVNGVNYIAVDCVIEVKLEALFLSPQALF